MANHSLCKIEGCGKPSQKRGWCGAHYQRWYAHGDPLGGGTAIGEPMRYYLEVVLAYDGDECLIWPYSRFKKGYGKLYRDGKHKRVHRAVCEEVNGPPLTREHEAAHSCGKGHEGCVTKGHLSWKTPAENQADRVEHGTSNRGERQGCSKLRESQVREIRSLKGIVSQKEAARRFGISREHVRSILNGKAWAWLE